MILLTMDQIEGLVKKMIKESLEFDEINRILGAGNRQTDYGVEDLEISGRAKDLLHPSPGNRSQQGITQAVDNLLKAEGLHADRDSFVYKKLCQEMGKAQAHIGEVQRKRDRGDY